MSKLFTDIASGNGRLEWIWFCHGMPWAVTTHQDVITALASPGTGSTALSGGMTATQQSYYRQLLFGEGSVTVNGTSTKASHGVRIYPTLDRDLGKFELGYSESKGLSGGDFGIKINVVPPGEAAAHRSGEIWHYDGIVIPDESIDPTICTARLSRTYTSDGTLYYSNDTGLKLTSRIATNFAAAVPTYVWIGTECVAIDGETNDEGGGEYSVSTTGGQYFTVPQKFLIEDADASPMPFADAPLGGIGGRPATLYAIPMDEDGNVLEIPTGITVNQGPWKWSVGQVGSISEWNNGQWHIDCKSFLYYLDQEIKYTPVHVHLKGFRFAKRGSANTPPHIRVKEYASSSWGSDVDLWLCGDNSVATFETREDVRAAVEETLNTSGSLNFDYHISDNGTISLTGNGSGDYAMLTGVATWGCGFGSVHASNWPEAYGGTYGTGLGDSPGFSGVGSPRPWFIRTANLDEGPWTYAGLTGDSMIPPVRAKYLYQYSWNDSELAAWDTGDFFNVDLCQFFVPAGAGSGGDARLYVDDDVGVDVLENGVDLLLRPIDGYPSAKFRLESTGSATYGQYVEIGDTYHPNQDTESGCDDASPAIVQYQWDDPTLKLFNKGAVLGYWPGVNESDPWVMEEAISTTSVAVTSPLAHIRAMIGKSTGVSVPTRYRLQGIPHANGETTGTTWFDMVDWDTIGYLMEESTIATSTSGWPQGPKVNFLDELRNTLLMNGLAMTWVFDSSVRACRISARRIGWPSITAAMLSGRKINNQVIGKDAKPSTASTGDKVFSGVRVSCNYNTEDSEFKMNFDVHDHSGRAQYVSGDYLEIKSHLSRVGVGDVSLLSEHFASFVRILMRAQPEQTVKATAKMLALGGVGVECEVDDPTAIDPYTGQPPTDDSYPVTGKPAMVTKISYDLGRETFGGTLSYRHGPGNVRGWAPAMNLADANMVLASNVLSITGKSTDQDYCNPAGGLVDLEHFDCLVWDAMSDTVTAADCTCDDYSIAIFDKDITDVIASGASSNYWVGTIGSVDGDAGTATITLLAATNFDDSTDKIVVFGKHANANTQPCQKKYLYFADENGELADGSVGGVWM